MAALFGPSKSDGSGSDGGSRPGRTRENNMIFLRVVVSAYLVYLGGSMIYEELFGGSAVSKWYNWVFGILFVESGAAFCWYSWRRWRSLSAEQEESDPTEKENHRTEQ